MSDQRKATVTPPYAPYGPYAIDAHADARTRRPSGALSQRQLSKRFRKIRRSSRWAAWGRDAEVEGDSRGAADRSTSTGSTRQARSGRAGAAGGSGSATASASPRSA